jgi:hypothetical protein
MSIEQILRTFIDSITRECGGAVTSITLDKRAYRAISLEVATRHRWVPIPVWGDIIALHTYNGMLIIKEEPSPAPITIEQYIEESMEDILSGRIVL